jgi:hypothetical protein
LWSSESLAACPMCSANSARSLSFITLSRKRWPGKVEMMFQNKCMFRQVENERTCRFVGIHDYPLCQNGSWIDGMAASLAFLGTGTLETQRSWLPEGQAALNSSTLDSNSLSLETSRVQIVGRGTGVWNPVVYAVHFCILYFSVFCACFSLTCGFIC